MLILSVILYLRNLILTSREVVMNANSNSSIGKNLLPNNFGSNDSVIITNQTATKRNELFVDVSDKENIIHHSRVSNSNVKYNFKSSSIQNKEANHKKINSIMDLVLNKKFHDAVEGINDLSHLPIYSIKNPKIVKINKVFVENLMQHAELNLEEKLAIVNSIKKVDYKNFQLDLIIKKLNSVNNYEGATVAANSISSDESRMGYLDFISCRQYNSDKDEIKGQLNFPDPKPFNRFNKQEK